MAAARELGLELRVGGLEEALRLRPEQRAAVQLQPDEGARETGARRAVRALPEEDVRPQLR